MHKSIAFAGLLACLGTDLDVGVPPGTALDWNREFRQPIPTGHRGSVPSADDRIRAAGDTIVEDRYKNIKNVDYMVTNLYDYFRVTTQDIGTHIKLTLPKGTGKVSQDDVATGGGFVMTWNYPPTTPVELVWMSAMACIREQVHPEVISWPESAVYCLELGEPALSAGKACEGKVASYLTKHLAPLPPDPPTPPKAKDLREAVFLRLVSVELTGGFPHALDPTFARRTLGLGDEAFSAVRDCAHNSHLFLARNAVAVLANYPRPEATDELKKIWKETQDPVLKVRAVLGLARRGEKSIVPDLVKMIEDKEEPMQALGIYALGILGDPAGVGPVTEVIRKAGIKDTDLLWSAVPALGRMHQGKDVLLGLRDLLGKKIKHNDTIKIQGDAKTPSAEENGAKFKVLHQMCLVSLALAGESGSLDEVLKRTLQKGSLDALHPATHYLLIEVLSGSDGGSEFLKKQVVAPLRAVEDNIKLESIRALVRAKKVDGPYLEELAMDATGVPVIRAYALQALADLDESRTKAACAKILGDFASSNREIIAGQAFFVAVAAQVGGKIEGALEAKDLVKAVERAFAAHAFSRREGNNDPDITKAQVSVFPALLETLIIELGRTASASAFGTLKTVITRSTVPQGRAEAVLALGAIPGKEASAFLVDALDDKDGWVRLCAYKALRKRSDQDHFCDWIFGDSEHRKKAASGYKAWLKGS
jgi:HEAT repeat protein